MELTREWREENKDSHADDWLRKIADLKNKSIKDNVLPKTKKPSPVTKDDIPYQLPNGWGWARLDDFVFTSIDCPHSTPKYKDYGRKFVRTSDFLPGKLVIGNIRYVTQEEFEQRNQRLIPLPNDILYSRKGGILGVACMIPENEYICLGQRMMIFRTESKIASSYLMHTLNSPLIVDKVKEFISGSASPHLNVGDIRNFLLPIPPEKECRVLLILLEQRFDTIERLDSELNSMLIKAKQDKQAILFAAFSGKLH